MYMYTHHGKIVPFRFAGSPPKMKPHVVNRYNKYMLGVDRLDQRMSYYQFVRKTVRWWRKVFFWMVEVVIQNSYMYILYTAHTDSRRKLKHREFRRELVLALRDDQCSATRHRQSCPHDQTLERLRGNHFPDNAPVCRDCRVCSVRGPGGQRHLTSGRSSCKHETFLPCGNH